MPLADWARVFCRPLQRNRLQPDMVVRTEEYLGPFFGTLQELGKQACFIASRPREALPNAVKSFLTNAGPRQRNRI